MFDDPRWGDDPRDRDDDPRERDRGDREEEWDQPGHRAELGDRDPDRDRDDDSRQLSRGPSSDDRDPYDRDRSDERSRDRDDRSRDPRDVFTRDLDLPRGQEREIVHDARGREYTLRGSESRTLSTAGAFRVVPARELWDHDGRRADVGRSTRQVTRSRRRARTHSACIVSRRAGDLFPVCWDAEGARSLLPLDFDDARMRLAGKPGTEIDGVVAQRFKTGNYHAPARAGIAYMLSPIRYRIDEHGVVVRTVSNPHLMFYGPNLTDDDIGGARGAFVFINRVEPTA